jgi:hypothetical protein
MDDIERLIDDLWARWEGELSHRPPAPEPSQAGGRVVYGRSALFDLKDYTPRRFRPQRRASRQVIPGIDNHVYHLDDKGRPRQMTTRHSFNRIDWIGVYSYSTEEADYREWCTQTGVCSQYDRLTLEDAVPASFQRLRINGQGSFPIWAWRTGQKVRHIRSSELNYQIWVERYASRHGRIESGVSFIGGMGWPPTRYELIYSYAGDKLERIVRRAPSGEEQTVFAARKASSLSALSAELSRAIAERALEVLRDTSLNSPLVALELAYQSHESYVPALLPLTEEDDIADLAQAAASIDRWLPLREEDFAPGITDFHERLRATEKHEAGTRMLRDAARQITERAPRQLRTAAHFVAFAVDWELEGDELPAILTACGASRDAMRAMAARGWIRT